MASASIVDGKLGAGCTGKNRRDCMRSSAFVELQAGKAYDLRLEYFEDMRDAQRAAGLAHARCEAIRSRKRSMPRAQPMSWCSSAV